MEERKPSSVASPKRTSLAPSVLSSVSSPTAYLQLVSFICSFGGFLYGFASSCINDSIPFIIRELGLRPEGVGLVTASSLVGGAVGSIVAGKLADRFGRKRVLVLFDAMYIVGVVCTACAPNMGLLVAARAFLGVSCGAIASAAPVLLSEISTPETRAKNVSMSLLFIVFGEMCVYIVGAVFGNIWYEVPSIWRWMNAVAIVPALVLFVCHAALLPESPRWLARSGQTELAFATLRRMRRSSLQTRIEMQEIDAVIRNNVKVKQPSMLDALTVSWIRSVLLIGIAVGMTQQAYGVIIGMIYGTAVLEEAGFDTKMALNANVAIGVVSFLSSWGGLLLVSRMGRRPLLMIGQIGSLANLVLIVTSSALLPRGLLCGWATLVLLLLLLMFSQGCISTVTWLLQAEIYPLSLRGIGAGMGMMVASAYACAIGQLFPIGVHYLGQSLTFSFFAVIGSLLLVFVWRFLPETRGKSLEELEQQFQAADWPTLKSVGRERANGGRGKSLETTKC